jgi:hypothetical protein
MSAHSDLEFDKQYALESVVKGLIESGPPGDFDAIQVTDRTEALKFMQARRDTLMLEKGPEGNLQLTIVESKVFSLRLSCDAPEEHPVDKVRGITADGWSFTKITVQKVDERGQPQTEQTDTDLLYLRTDHGTLRSADGDEEIRSINLVNGRAVFRLVSDKARRIATVKVINADPNLRDSSFAVEFI